jgi:hypothetical protein
MPTQETVHPEDAFEDTSVEQSFELVKFKTRI